MNIKQRIKAKETRIGKVLIVLSLVGELLLESFVQLSTYTSLFPEGESIHSLLPPAVANTIRIIALVGIIAGKLTVDKNNLEEGPSPKGQDGER